MVEILSVLAIMGILGISAVAAYNYLLNKTQATLLVKDARLLHANLLGKQTPQIIWADVIEKMATKYPKQTMVDRVLKPYVKVAEIDESVCRHLLAITQKEQLMYYNTDWEEFTECNTVNEIIFAFDGQGKMAQCLAATDCPDADNQICNSEYQCANCGDLKVRNEEGTECVCDTDSDVVSCSTDNGENWCCEKNKLCGWNTGNCVADDGCKYVLTDVPTDNTCHYTLSVNADNNAVMIEDKTTHTCSDGQYCYLQYSSDTCSGTSDTAIDLWGACNDLSKGDVSSCRTSMGTMKPKKSCPPNYYCYLMWTNQTCKNTDDTAATIYGRCIEMNKGSASCPATWGNDDIIDETI